MATITVKTDVDHRPLVRIAGRVTAAPTCPVERAGHPCPPGPVRATIEPLTTRGRVVATLHTDAHGSFAARLAPGSYLFRVTSPGAFPRCPDVRAKVSARRRTRADIRCDTGIR
jgi:hypothetical protein